MKKILFAIVALVSIFFVSCTGNNTQPVTSVTPGYFIPKNEIVENQEVKYFRVAEKGDDLWNLAARTLGDSTRWGELMVQTPEIGNHAHQRFFIFKGKKPGVKIFPGDTVWVPGYPNYCQSISGKKTIELITSKSLEDYSYNRVDTVANAVAPIVSIPGGSSNSMPEWLSDLLWFMLTIALAALLAWFIIYLWNNRGQNNNPNPPAQQAPPAPANTQPNIHVQVDNHCCCGRGNCQGNCNECPERRSDDNFTNWFGASMLMDSMGKAVPNGKLKNTIWYPNGSPAMSTEIDNCCDPFEKLSKFLSETQIEQIKEWPSVRNLKGLELKLKINAIFESCEKKAETNE